MRKQIGQILIEKGILKQENLEQALKAQAKFEKRGKHRYIGNILVKMGFVTQEQLDDALRQQKEQERTVPYISKKVQGLMFIV